MKRLALRRLPSAAIVEATTACNLRCPLCPTHLVERKRRFLDPSLVQRLVQSGAGALKDAGFHIMGEPSLHPELHRMVRTCEEAGIRTRYGSNGMRLAGDVDGILESGLSVLSVAIDGFDEPSYQRYRRNGKLATVLAGVDHLLKQRAARGLDRPQVQVQVIMFPYNERGSEAIEAMLRDL
ncbi:MAG: radical SAM protein [Planctomycetota bacterium]